MRAMVMAVLSLAIAGCGPPTGIVEPDPQAVQPHDFAGALREHELDDWQVSGSGLTVGGPGSRLLVGPARFILTDGTRVVIPSSTPGANACRPLSRGREPASGRCVIIGEFIGEGPDARWFGVLGTQDEDDERRGTVDADLMGVHEGSGLISAASNIFVFELADEITVDPGCRNAPERPVDRDEFSLPQAAVHVATIDLSTHRIVGIACGYAA